MLSYQLAQRVFLKHQFKVHSRHHNLLEHREQITPQQPIKGAQLRIQQKLQLHLFRYANPHHLATQVVMACRLRQNVQTL